VRIASLGSGSKGNGTFVEGTGGVVLVDLGFGIKETLRRMATRSISPWDIKAILITHEHGDHIHGAAQFARKFHLPLYMTTGTFDLKRFEGGLDVRRITLEEPFTVAGMEIHPVTVPHDAKEPCQYVFSEGESRVGVLTDIGHITPHVANAYHACDALVLECNYDPEMLVRGPYPRALKARVSGPLGHLSNEQAAGLLESVDLNRLKHIVVSHISEKNNQPALAEAALRQVLHAWEGSLHHATQQNGLDWIPIG